MRLSILGLAIALVTGLACLAAVTAPAAAQAQRSADDYGAARARRAPARIVITPDRRPVRECEAWYALENRLAGPVMTPQMRCRWVYR